MVFGLFSKKASPDKKLVERATNKLAQQADRIEALEALRAMGTEEALVGLCKRWSVTSSKGVEDEFEKNWVVDALTGAGKSAFGPLGQYMKSAETLSFALRTLDRITNKGSDTDGVSKASALALVDELFKSEPPGYTRHPERRIELISWLAEWDTATSAEVVPRLVPYLSDFDENSRFAAIDGVARHDSSLIAEPLAQTLARPDEESGRIRRTIAEIIVRKRLPVGSHAAAIEAVLTGPLSGIRVQDGTLVGHALV